MQDDVVKPRALHRTTSVFLRNLAPTINKSELETVSETKEHIFLYYLNIGIFFNEMFK